MTSVSVLNYNKRRIPGGGGGGGAPSKKQHIDYINV